MVPMVTMARLEERDDQALLLSYYGGSFEAFEALYHRYKNPLYSFLLAKLVNRADAEDCLQEVFIKVAKSRDGSRWKPSGTVKSWLFTVARRVAIDRVRSAGRRTDDADGDEVIPTVPDEGTPKPDLKQLILRCIEALSDEHKEVVRARGLIGLTFDEISDALDIKTGTAKSRFRTATIQLKACLEGEDA